MKLQVKLLICFLSFILLIPLGQSAEGEKEKNQAKNLRNPPAPSGANAKNGRETGPETLKVNSNSPASKNQYIILEKTGSQNKSTAFGFVKPYWNRIIDNWGKQRTGGDGLHKTHREYTAYHAEHFYS